MSSSLNLATRPFGNEVLPWIGVGALAVLSVGASAWHARELGRLAGGEGAARAAAVQSMQSELQQLRLEERSLHGEAPDAESLRRWAQLSHLVDRRSFSWTLLLSRLEAALPWDVRLLDVSPSGLGQDPELTFTAVARSTQSALALIDVLEGQPEFFGVRPQSLAEDEDGAVRIRYTLRYDPSAAAGESSGAQSGARGGA